LKLAAIGLGSNIEPRLEALEKSILWVDSLIGKVIQKSKIYESEPWGVLNQSYFLNQVVLVETELNPLEVLQYLKKIEALMGREEGERWGPRLIDLDLLFLDREIFHSSELLLPHPRLHERNFVLLPLQEVFSEWVHPTYQMNIRDLLRYCQDEGIVTLYREA
jgi:2-amino-4-hydroxy-6-hydroxymethyldihydropteridine diphosphokinase